MGKLNQQQKMMLMLGVCVLVGGYFYFTSFLNPTMKKIKDQEVKFADLIQQIENAERQARRLPQLQAEYAQLQVQLSSLEQQLPTDKDFPGILRLVTREAASENLTFVSLKPNDPKRDQSGYFEVIDFDIQMTGSLQSFVRFMSSLGQQDRIFQFDRLTLNGAGQEGSGLAKLNFNFVLKTYAYVG